MPCRAPVARPGICRFLLNKIKIKIKIEEEVPGLWPLADTRARTVRESCVTYNEMGNRKNLADKKSERRYEVEPDQGRRPGADGAVLMSLMAVLCHDSEGRAWAGGGILR